MKNTELFKALELVSTSEQIKYSDKIDQHIITGELENGDVIKITITRNTNAIYYILRGGNKLWLTYDVIINDLRMIYNDTIEPEAYEQLDTVLTELEKISRNQQRKDVHSTYDFYFGTLG